MLNRFNGYDYNGIDLMGHTLTVAAGHTLRGAGYVAPGYATASVVNRGTIVVENLGFGDVDNHGGVIRIPNWSSYLSAQVSGGIVQGGGTLGGSLKDLTLSGSFGAESGLAVQGHIRNTGSLYLGGHDDSEYSLVLQGTTTLSGGGETVLTGASRSVPYPYAPGVDVQKHDIDLEGHTLTIAPEHTLRGTGLINGDGIGGTLINEGSLRVAGQQGISLLGVNLDNRGTIYLDELSTLEVGGDLMFSSDSQLILAANYGDRTPLISHGNGQVTLGGAVTLISTSDAAGDTFTFLQSDAALIGTFDSVTMPGYRETYEDEYDGQIYEFRRDYRWIVNYAEHSVSISVTAVDWSLTPVPESSTWAMLLGGVLMLEAWRRRNRTA